MKKTINLESLLIRCQRSRGQSLVELALTLTIILTLLAGAVDLGSAFFDYIALRDAAQEGALYGSINPENTSDIVNRVRQSSSNPLDLTSADVSIDVLVTGSPCAGSQITVTVDYTYQLIMPLIGSILGSSSIPLSASVTDTILSPPCSP